MKQNSSSVRPSSPVATRRMKSVRSAGTAAEIQLQRCLRRLGLRFCVNALASPTRCRPDLIVQDQRVAIFVDGCFWHSCPRHRSWPRANREWWRDKIERNCERDRRLRRELRRNGWKVVRVWEHENPERAAKKIHELVLALPSLTLD